MQNFQDKDLDDFFKKSSENVRLTFNPKAWELMEQKLKTAQLKKAFYRRIIYSGLFLLFITAAIVSLNEGSLVKTEKNNDHVNNNLTGSETSGEISNQGKSAISRDSPASVGKYPSEMKKRQFQINPGKTVNSNFDDFNKEINGRKIIFNEAGSENRGLSLLNKESYWPSSTSAFKTVFVSHMEGLLKTRKIQGSKSELMVNNISEDNSKKRPSNKNYQDVLRINALFSPDISSAFPLKNVQSGYNTGITIEYFILKNLAVSVGILKSKKIYSSSAENYNPDDNYWKNYKKPEGIEGNCLVTDIPVNVKYFYCDKSKLRAFASVGVSSYLMRKEAYTYDYTTYDKTYNFSKENNHLFSVLNLSTGAEYRLGRGFSIGIEPFLKVATSGVGAGKIKLNSGGAFISIGYSLIKK